MPINCNEDEIRKIPHFTRPFQAALWIREKGNIPLTNQTFRGLLADLCGGNLSKEESNNLRVMSRPGWKGLSCNSLREGFLTEEEGLELMATLSQLTNVPNLSYEMTPYGVFVKYYD